MGSLCSDFPSQYHVTSLVDSSCVKHLNLVYKTIMETDPGLGVGVCVTSSFPMPSSVDRKGRGDVILPGGTRYVGFLESLGHGLDPKASFGSATYILTVLLMLSNNLNFCLILATLGDLLGVGGFLCKVRMEF